MRPSSGGSRRISKRFEPSCARATISTARPATGTALSAPASTRNAVSGDKVGRIGGAREMERHDRQLCVTAPVARSRRGCGAFVAARLGRRRWRGGAVLGGRVDAARPGLSRLLGLGCRRTARRGARRRMRRARGCAPLGSRSSPFRTSPAWVPQARGLRGRRFGRGRRGGCGGLLRLLRRRRLRFAARPSRARAWPACGVGRCRLFRTLGRVRRRCLGATSAGAAGAAACHRPARSSASSAAGSGAASTAARPPATGVATGAEASMRHGRDDCVASRFGRRSRRLFRRGRRGFLRRLRVAFATTIAASASAANSLRQPAASRRARPRPRSLSGSVGSEGWPFLACRVSGEPRACWNCSRPARRAVRLVASGASRVVAARADRCARIGAARAGSGRSARSARSVRAGRGSRDVSSRVSNASLRLGRRGRAAGNRLRTQGPQGDRVRRDFGQGRGPHQAQRHLAVASRGPSDGAE